MAKSRWKKSGLLFSLVIFVALVAAPGIFAEEAPPSFDQFLASVAAANDADGSMPFSAAAFAAAADAGDLIVVHVNAFWCSTCGAQRSSLADVVKDLKNDPNFAKLVVFRLDFDRDKDLVRSFGVEAQGTLIVFRGRREIGRSLGDTDQAAIRALLIGAGASAPPDARAERLFSAGGWLLLALLAGLLSSLSPCVLPLLPIVVGGAVAVHRLGPAALVGGFALSFVALGLFIGLIGRSIGLDQEKIRLIAAGLMILFGIALVSTSVQLPLSLVEDRIQSIAEQVTDWVGPAGLRGQFVIGLMLGGIWSPCIGPTLGAAITLAGRAANTVSVAIVMLFFAVGVAMPLFAIGLASQRVLRGWQHRIAFADHVVKIFFGLVMIALGGAILINADRTLETFLLRMMPDWLIRLSTFY